MELAKFLKVLMRHRLTLIIIPITTIVITYFLVRNMLDTYMSQAQIATGIVDETQQMPFEVGIIQEAKVNQDFGTLMEMMRMKKILDQVSYQLVLHDLTSKTPFKSPSSKLKDLSPEAKKHAIAIFKNKHQKREGLNLFNRDQNGLHKLLRSMKYDDESLKKKLGIYRAGTSDFVYIEFISENPVLSAFVVNTLCSEFIVYYTSLLKVNQQKSVSFLAKLLQEKSDALKVKTEQLRAYKIQNRILNLYEQSKQLYGLILDYESRKSQAEKDIIATTGALANIDSKFKPADRRYLESTLTKVNQDILSTKEKLKALHNTYIQSGFDKKYQTSIDSLQNVLTTQINQSTDKYIYSPLSAKQDLVQQKLRLEIQLELAKNSVGALIKDLAHLNALFDQLVPHEAVVQSLERDIDIARQEYLDALNKYNLTDMESGYSVKIRQVQAGTPGLALPSKKMLLVILSGIISLVFCVVVLFILFFLDDSITNQKELAQKTELPVLGALNTLSGDTLDMNRIWKGQNLSASSQLLKDQLRSIRFEIDSELNHYSDTLAITSINSGEGKTFLAVNLAYAYSIINKRVLLIDGNFKNPALSRTVKPDYYLEDFFKNEDTADDFLNKKDLITIMGNRGGDISLLELNREACIKQKINVLKENFDVIIIETAALETLSKSKEWFLFANKIFAVFESNQSIKDTEADQINYLKSLDKKFGGWILNKVSEQADTPDKKRWFQLA